MAPVDDPVRIWLILGCQFTVTRGCEGVMGMVCSDFRVAGEKIWRFPFTSPVRTLVPLGENIMLLSGWIGVANSLVFIGVLSFRVSHTRTVISILSCR